MNHTKQLLVGFALGLVVVAAVAAAVSGSPIVGRFQLSTTQEHAYVIDTQTGQVWEKGINGGTNFYSAKVKISNF
jgi:hypothetical protein